MSNRVYTYTKITELKDAPFYKEILTMPQISMSKEMAGLRFSLPGIGKNIISFSRLMTMLFPGWDSSDQRFRFITILNRFLRERIHATSDKHEKEWLYGCKKNLNVAITNIINLEEAQVDPDDISEDDRDISLFKEMWRLLIDGDDTINEFRKRLSDLTNTEIFNAAIDEIIGKLLTVHGKKEIIFNGFQFFTPIQFFIYKCFIRAGYDVIALIQDDNRYPYANEIWDHLYNPSYGFPERDNWIREYGNKKNPLGEIFETGSNVSAPGVRIIKYKNTVEFVEDISRLKDEGYYIYSSDDKTANNILKDYFPERYESKDLLAYPIGQFIYILHKMWDENMQCISVETDKLRKVFASGWLSYKGRSSVNYTEDLERIIPFFEDCHTIEDWQKRMGQFKDAYTEAVDNFKSNDGDSKDIRTKELLGNPFSNFGIYSVKESSVDAVIDIIKDLIKMASDLFGKNEPISIEKHISKLDNLLHMNDGMPQDLFLKEREIVKKIYDSLISDKIKDYLYYPGDLAQAMVAFIGNKLDEDESDKHELKTLVFNIFQIESAPLAAKGKVHVCMADIQKLPGRSGSFTWPLDTELLEGIVANTGNEYIKEWLENNKLTALTNRYYIYTALQNEDVEISWVEKQGEKIFSPSPYITLLDKLSDSKIEESNVRHIDSAVLSSILADKKLEKNFDITKSGYTHQPEEELEYSICPMRYIYGYVLGNSPAYRNEFQQNKAIVRLIQSFNAVLRGKYKLEEVAEQVFELFPGLRKAEKRQMIDDAKKRNLPNDEGGYYTYDNTGYSNYRINLKFPDFDTYDAARELSELLMGPEGRKGISYENLGPDREKNCVYCPHSSYCRHSLFGIDYKGMNL